MKINQILIENFRCFKGMNQFDIGGKTIILYGENGFGKSSFFDAIEWCLTGSVDRFKQPGERNINKKIIYNRLATEGENCSVELIIEGIKIKRSFRIIEGARETLVVRDLSNNTIASGKENVEKFIEENIANKTANKKLLTTLIKRSHLLSQDQITDFVLRDNPKDRFDSLADIMGYRQLMNLAKNLRKVKNEINRNMNKQSERIVVFKNVIESKQGEKVEFDLLKTNNVLEELNINVNHNDVLSEIRKKEKSLVDKKARLDEKMSNFNNLRNDIKTYSYNDLEKKSKQLHNEIVKVEKKRKRIERLLDKIHEEENLISKKIAKFDTQKNTYNEKIKLEKKITELNSEISNYNVTEENLEHLITKEEKKLEELYYVQTHLKSYLSFKEVINNNPTLINVKKSQIDKYDRKISKYNEYLRAVSTLLDNEKESTSLNSLNNAIQDVYSYVSNNKEKNNVCPVCSTQKENLSETILNNIEKNLYIIQKNSSKISKINEIIKNIKYKIEKLNKTKTDVENELKNLKTNLELSRDSLSKIRDNHLFKKEVLS